MIKQLQYCTTVSLVISVKLSVFGQVTTHACVNHLHHDVLKSTNKMMCNSLTQDENLKAFQVFNNIL